MRIVIASDSFKGSLTGEQINNIWLDSVKDKSDKFSVVPLLIADGGDGTLDAVIKQKRGKIITETVCNPLFEKISSRFGVFEDSAVISMCECSGLTLIPESLRNPLKTTSYGTGELIRKAILAGKKQIYITLGGSATNDGGIGALTALGYKFIKKDGTIAKGVGEELGEIHDIDDSEKIDTENTEFIILSDVTNLLTGENGAARIFAKQKGATEEQIEFLERGMLNFAKVLENRFKVKVNEIRGGGAAGGMGAGLSVMLNAKIKSGVEEILNIVGFDKIVDDADLVITGEGRIDGQSKDGKVVSGIIKHANKFGVPVIAVVGTVGEDFDLLNYKGLKGVFSIIDSPADLPEILYKSETLYKKTAESIIGLLEILS